MSQIISTSSALDTKRSFIYFMKVFTGIQYLKKKKSFYWQYFESIMSQKIILNLTSSNVQILILEMREISAYLIR